MKVFASWSGGKESCFACYKAIQNGFDVSYILNNVSKKYNRVSFHGVKSELVLLQSQVIGIQLVQLKVTKSNYEQEFKKVVRKLKELGVTGGVFGDIDLQEHRDWVEKFCRGLEIEPVLPLWDQNREQLLNDFINKGFEATVVSTKADLLGEEWLGRKIDKSFIRDLLEVRDVDLCGEYGEYHTFVTNGPLFRKHIKILETGKVFRRGYWFLDIKKCVVV